MWNKNPRFQIRKQKANGAKDTRLESYKTLSQAICACYIKYHNGHYYKLFVVNDKTGFVYLELGD